VRDNTIENKRTNKTRVDNIVHPSWDTSLGPLPNSETALLILKCLIQWWLTMENLKKPLHYDTQTQKQRLPLNSSWNYKKNKYKLNYVLNRCPNTPFGMLNERWLSYKKNCTKIFIHSTLAHNRHHHHIPLRKLRKMSLHFPIFGHSVQRPSLAHTSGHWYNSWSKLPPRDPCQNYVPPWNTIIFSPRGSCQPNLWWESLKVVIRF
jgi:hypothetical protein